MSKDTYAFGSRLTPDRSRWLAYDSAIFSFFRSFTIFGLRPILKFFGSQLNQKLFYLLIYAFEVETHIMYKNTKVWVFCENSFFSNYMGFHLTSLPRELAFHATPRAFGFDLFCCCFCTANPWDCQNPTEVPEYLGWWYQLFAGFLGAKMADFQLPRGRDRRQRTPPRAVSWTVFGGNQI